jgi:aspartate 1-decarboxylase
VFVDDRNRIADLGPDPGRAPEGSGLLSGSVGLADAVGRSGV